MDQSLQLPSVVLLQKLILLILSSVSPTPISITDPHGNYIRQCIHVTASLWCPISELGAPSSPRKCDGLHTQSPALVPQPRQQNGADHIAALTVMYVLCQGLHFVAGCTKPAHQYATGTEKKMGASDAEREAWRKRQCNIRLEGERKLMKST